MRLPHDWAVLQVGAQKSNTLLRARDSFLGVLMLDGLSGLGDDPRTLFLGPGASEKAQQTLQDGEGVRRAAGNVEVDGDRAVGAVVDLRVIDVRAAGDGAGADGEHDRPIPD